MQAFITKWPNLKLKTWPKQLLGSLPLAFALPITVLVISAKVCAHHTSNYKKKLLYRIVPRRLKSVMGRRKPLKSHLHERRLVLKTQTTTANSCKRPKLYLPWFLGRCSNKQNCSYLKSKCPRSQGKYG